MRKLEKVRFVFNNLMEGYEEKWEKSVQKMSLEMTTWITN